MNKFNFTLLVSAVLLVSGSLFAQAPAAFDFPNGCTQATLNGTSFTVEVKLDGMSAENNMDWVAVFNANDEVVGRAIVEQIFSNGAIVSGATRAIQSFLRIMTVVKLTAPMVPVQRLISSTSFPRRSPLLWPTSRPLLTVTK